MKQKKKGKGKRKPVQRRIKHEIVVRVQPQPVVIPTVEDLSVPEKDGKALTIPKTWMSERQIMRMVQQTPAQHRYQRKGRGGQMFDYVTGSYVEKVLNFVFGWNWDFEVVREQVKGSHIVVLGRLTVRGKDAGQQIVKTQYGRAEIKYLKDKSRTDENMVDFGNDMKAAATDALKKCASLLGIASDVYGKSDYKQETDREPIDNTPKLPAAAPAAVQEEAQAEPIYCHGVRKGCPNGNELSIPERDYSKQMYGKPLCRDCQKDATPLKKRS